MRVSCKIAAWVLLGGVVAGGGAPGARAASILMDTPATGGAYLGVDTIAPLEADTNGVAWRHDATLATTNLVLRAPPAGTLPPAPLAAPDLATVAENTDWAATPPAGTTLDDATLDAIMDNIRAAYEETAPHNPLDDAHEAQFLDVVRKKLEASALPLPTTDPDNYRRRPIPEFVPTGERNALITTDEDHSLTISERDGQRVYTYRDAGGNILYEGPIETQEDRAKMPFEVWKRYYEIEQNALPPPTRP